MRTIYQLDTTTKLPVLLFGFIADESSMPFYCVETPPPEATEGKVLYWNTQLDPVADAEYGKAGTGRWELKDDNRSKELFLIADGSAYSIGSDTSKGAYNGIGAIPDWLSDIEKPSVYHSWSGDQWVVRAEDEEQRLVDLSASVRQQRDALIAQSDWTQLDDSPYKGDAAWLDYRQQLRDITVQPGFPDSVNWPTSP